ncbi:MAG: hypothetical protein ACTSRZ_05795 [Promethearchaeota archaeon]
MLQLLFEVLPTILERVDFYLWIGAIILNFLFMAMMIPRFREPETALSGLYFKGVFFFFLIHGFSRVAYLIKDYFINEEVIYEIGVALGLASIVFLIYYIESSIYTKSRHMFFAYGIFSLIISIISVILTILGLSSVVVSIILQYATLPVLGVVILWIYVYTAIKTTGRVRQNTIIVLVGIIIFMVGQMAHTPTAIDLFGDWVTFYTSPILLITGLATFYYGLVRRIK